VEKIFSINRTKFIFLCIGLGIILGGIFLLGRTCQSQPTDNGNSELDVEYGRQMGFATELIDELDAGIGRIQIEITGIAAIAGQNANDLRSLAGGLQQIAIIVKKMEDDLDSLRGRVRDFNNDDNNLGSD